MNKMKKLAVAVLAVAGLSGCATPRYAGQAARSADLSKTEAAPAVEHQVSRPTQSYGSLGGYRYRRFVAVNASAS
jgi:uncharacterized lipoprotein